MPGAAVARVSYREYLAAEEQSDVKHEYCDGVVVAMAGGTPDHSRLKSNLLFRLSVALDGKPCRPFDSDLRVRVPATGLVTYPDVSVICGTFQPDAEDSSAATNPTALFEVLSPSTAGYDHGEKFDHYAKLPSLAAYVLLDHTRPHVDLYTRSSDGSWARRGYGPGERVRVDAIGVSLVVDEIYEGWAALRETLRAATAAR